MSYVDDFIEVERQMAMARAQREEIRHYQQRSGEEDYRRRMMAMLDSPFMPSSANVETLNPKKELKKLKRSIKQIEAEPFTGESRQNIQKKIDRLNAVGAMVQAKILHDEIILREALTRLKEWDYKILTKETIGEFERKNKMSLTRDGLKIHIDPLERYIGNPETGSPKDRIIPDNILDGLEQAQERRLFTSFSVLWAERVPDPILLGQVEGCEDYFFIAEWGQDITFDQITKGKF